MYNAEIAARTRAERYRRLAAKTVDPIDKYALQRMADEWLRLAQVRGGDTGPVLRSITEAAH